MISRNFKKTISVTILVLFVLNNVLSVTASSQVLNLPSPGKMVPLSPAFQPALIRGIKIFPDNPLRFDFIIDKGETEFDEGKFKTESEQLIRYFLTSLTVPEKDLWVNLSPYEKDRIIPNKFGVTEMGRDLLAQDYLLKQITSSLMYPEDELGQKFWDRIYKEAYEKYGTTEIPIDTFNKVWIVPDKAVVYENGDSAFVVKSRLKVMLDNDYVAMQNRDTLYVVRSTYNVERTTNISSEIIHQIIIPALEKEVNEGKNFVQLRQIYNSLILATWYKRNLKKSTFAKAYVGKNKINGVDVADKQIKQKIYNQYLEAFKKGVYNYIKEEYDPQSKSIIPHKYFSGGMDMAMLGKITSKVYKESHNSNQIYSFINRDDGLYIAKTDLNFTKDNAMTTKEESHFKLSYDKANGKVITWLNSSIDELKDARTWEKFIQALKTEPKIIDPKNLHEYMASITPKGKVEIGSYSWEDGPFSYLFKFIKAGKNKKIKWLQYQGKNSAYFEISYRGCFTRDMFPKTSKKIIAQNLFNKINKKLFGKWKVKKFGDLNETLIALNISTTPFKLLKNYIIGNRELDLGEIEPLLEKARNIFNKDFLDLSEPELEKLGYSKVGIFLKRFILQKLNLFNFDKGWHHKYGKDILAVHILKPEPTGGMLWEYYQRTSAKEKKEFFNYPIVEKWIKSQARNKTPSYHLLKITDMFYLQNKFWFGFFLSTFSEINDNFDRFLIYLKSYSAFKKYTDSSITGPLMRLITEFSAEDYTVFKHMAFPLAEELIKHYKNIDELKDFLNKQPLAVADIVKLLLPKNDPSYSEIRLQTLIEITHGKMFYNFANSIAIRQVLITKYENLEDFDHMFEDNLLYASENLYNELKNKKRLDLFSPTKCVNFFVALGKRHRKMKYLGYKIKMREELRSQFPTLDDLEKRLFKIPSISKRIDFLKKQLSNKYYNVQIKNFIFDVFKKTRSQKIRERNRYNIEGEIPDNITPQTSQEKKDVGELIKKFFKNPGLSDYEVQIIFETFSKIIFEEEEIKESLIKAGIPVESYQWLKEKAEKLKQKLEMSFQLKDDSMHENDLDLEDSDIEKWHRDFKEKIFQINGYDGKDFSMISENNEGEKKGRQNKPSYVNNDLLFSTRKKARAMILHRLYEFTGGKKYLVNEILGYNMKYGISKIKVDDIDYAGTKDSFIYNFVSMRQDDVKNIEKIPLKQITSMIEKKISEVILNIYGWNQLQAGIALGIAKTKVQREKVRQRFQKLNINISGEEGEGSNTKKERLKNLIMATLEYNYGNFTQTAIGLEISAQKFLELKEKLRIEFKRKDLWIFNNETKNKIQRYKSELTKEEKRITLIEVLNVTRGNIKDASEILNVSEGTIKNNINKFNIDIKKFKGKKNVLYTTKLMTLNDFEKQELKDYLEKLNLTYKNKLNFVIKNINELSQPNNKYIQRLAEVISDEMVYLFTNNIFKNSIRPKIIEQISVIIDKEEVNNEDINFIDGFIKYFHIQIQPSLMKQDEENPLSKLLDFAKRVQLPRNNTDIETDNKFGKTMNGNHFNEVEFFHDYTKKILRFIENSKLNADDKDIAMINSPESTADEDMAMATKEITWEELAEREGYTLNAYPVDFNNLLYPEIHEIEVFQNGKILKNKLGTALPHISRSSKIVFLVYEELKLIYLASFHPCFAEPKDDVDKIGRGRILLKHLFKNYPGYHILSNASDKLKESILKIHDFSPYINVKISKILPDMYQRIHKLTEKQKIELNTLLKSYKIYARVPDSDIPNNGIINDKNAQRTLNNAPQNNKGGIDFNGNKINIETKGEGADFNIPEVDIEKLKNDNFTGFTPIILEVTPLANLPMFLGLSTTEDNDHNQELSYLND